MKTMSTPVYSTRERRALQQLADREGQRLLAAIAAFDDARTALFARFQRDRKKRGA